MRPRKMMRTPFSLSPADLTFNPPVIAEKMSSNIHTAETLPSWIFCIRQR